MENMYGVLKCSFWELRNVSSITHDMAREEVDEDSAMTFKEIYDRSFKVDFVKLYEIIKAQARRV